MKFEDFCVNMHYIGRGMDLDDDVLTFCYELGYFKYCLSEGLSAERAMEKVQIGEGAWVFSDEDGHDLAIRVIESYAAD